MKTYKILRIFFSDKEKMLIKTNLTLEEAQEHCNDDETSSKTCKSKEMVRFTEKNGSWFDAYYEE